jgi:5-methylcytosine-specific restriction endonuclease McrA
MEKFEKIRNLLGHQLSDQQYATLIEELANIALKKLEPKPPTLAVKKEPASETRYIPANVKRAVWQRDGGRCAHVSPNGRCDSRYSLQYEHIVPFGKGGKSTCENLKLICPAHNQYTAIQAYGLPKMQEFWAK